jgi:hypothetical protein
MKKLAVLFVGLVCFLLTMSFDSTNAQSDNCRTETRQPSPPFAKEVKAKPPPGQEQPHGTIVEPCGFDKNGMSRLPA